MHTTDLTSMPSAATGLVAVCGACLKILTNWRFWATSSFDIAQE